MAAILTMIAMTSLLGAENCNRLGICGPCIQESVNPATRPFTLNPCCCEEGEFTISVAAFYWQATQDGLEYAIRDFAVTDATTSPITANLVTLVNSHYLNPEFKWRPGFKVGIGYNGTHDGWDLELAWTHFNGRGKDSDEADFDEGVSDLTLWSDFSPQIPGVDFNGGTILHAEAIKTSWRVDLNLADLELGREFWTSKYFTLRPFVGIRYVSAKQTYLTNNFGGTWRLIGRTNQIKMKNWFEGAGTRFGLDGMWKFGCCDPCSGSWGIFGNAAFSIVYGRFEVSQKEFNRASLPNFDQSPVMNVSDKFKTTRAILDLSIGLEWCKLYNDNGNLLNITLAWQQYQFFNQNQLWRINSIGDNFHLHGENVFLQSKGDLSTQGVTLTFNFTF